ncbi:MAG: repressor LexA [Deferribacteres bacterium]|nr:transcriptional repressor LexA [candidate division KSB1 bacterium]MCB9503076.1 repressor LexA [Deferribacteres bacterium]
MNKKLTEKQYNAFRFIRNSLVHDGKSPSVRELMKKLGYNSPNAAAYVIESLIDLGLIERKEDKKLVIAKDLEPETPFNERTIPVPLLGVVPCGVPVISDENTEAIISVSEKLAKPPHKYFFLRANGNSMNAAGIEDGDLVLIKQQATAKDGDHVVALVDGESTIKEFRRDKNVVLLNPKSTDKSYKPIVVTSDLKVQGIVVTALTGI